MTQIEAKALEEFPVRLPAKAFGYAISDQDQNEKERAAFIKGCQYAATPSAVSREDAEKWIDDRWDVPTDRVNSAANSGAHSLLDYLEGKSLSPAQPVAGLQWVKAEVLPELYKTIPVKVGKDFASGFYTDGKGEAYCFEDEVEYTDEDGRLNEGWYITYEHESVIYFIPAKVIEWLDESSPAQPGYSEQQVREAIRLARPSELKRSEGQSSWAGTHTPDEIISLLNKQP